MKEVNTSTVLACENVFVIQDRDGLALSWVACWNQNRSELASSNCQVISNGTHQVTVSAKKPDSRTLNDPHLHPSLDTIKTPSGLYIRMKATGLVGMGPNRDLFRCQFESSTCTPLSPFVHSAMNEPFKGKKVLLITRLWRRHLPGVFKLLLDGEGNENNSSDNDEATAAVDRVLRKYDKAKMLMGRARTETKYGRVEAGILLGLKSFSLVGHAT